MTSGTGEPSDLSDVAERCPACRARIAAEARTCVACGRVLFDAEHGPWTDAFLADPIEALDEDGKLPRLANLEFQELEPVFVGSLSEALALRASLGAMGLAVFLVDETMKSVDPFITGADVFNVGIVAACDQADRVREAIADVERDDVERAEDRGAAATRLSRFALVGLIMFPPVSVVACVRALRLGVGHGLRIGAVSWILVMLLVALCETLVIAFAIWRGFGAALGYHGL